MTDYKTPVDALIAAIDYICRDGERKIADHRLVEVSFGRRNDSAGAGYYWTARYIVEAENGEVPVVRQTTADQLEMVTQGWSHRFEVCVKPMEVL